MIKKIYKKEKKIVKTLISEKYFCDRCGKEIKKDTFSLENYRIKFDNHRSYASPGGGSIEGDRAYFCSSCAMTIKLFLIKIGVKFTEIEIDF